MGASKSGSGDPNRLAIGRRTALSGLVGGGVAAGVTALSAKRLFGSQQQVIRPEDFAGPHDGDDAAPGIQAAIEHAAATGGGIVRLTAGKTYLLRAIAPGSDVSGSMFRASLAIPPRTAKLTIDLNGAILLQQSDAFTFGAAYRRFNDEPMEATRQALDYTPRRGDTSIRVPDATTYTVGRRIMLVSGNLYPPRRTSPTHHPYTPIAEMFEIIGARDGAILIDRPVQKNHELARGREVGLIDITNHYAEGLRIIGPGKIINFHRRAGALRQIFGFQMDRVAFQGSGGFSIRGRDLTVTDCSVDIIRGGDKRIPPYALAFDTGSNDITVKRFKANGSPFCYIHLREGLSNVLLSDVEILNSSIGDPSWVDTAAIGIMGLSWNVRLENVLVVNNPQGVGIGARESTVIQGGNYGLMLDRITLRGRFRHPALQIYDKIPAQVSDLDVSRVERSTGQPPIRLIGAHHQIAGLHE